MSAARVLAERRDSPAADAVIRPIRSATSARRWDPVRFEGPQSPATPEDDERRHCEDTARPADLADLPEPSAWAATLVRAAVEVLKGHRSAAQLIRWLEADLWAALSRHAQLGVQVGRALDAAPVRVRRVHGCAITTTAWEGSVVIDDGGRTRAVALRLEVVRGRWCATALTIG